jgi:hypothetical protein
MNKIPQPTTEFIIITDNDFQIQSNHGGPDDLDYDTWETWLQDNLSDQIDDQLDTLMMDKDDVIRYHFDILGDTLSIVIETDDDMIDLLNLSL